MLFIKPTLSATVTKTAITILKSTNKKTFPHADSSTKMSTNQKKTLTTMKGMKSLSMNGLTPNQHGTLLSPNLLHTHQEETVLKNSPNTETVSLPKMPTQKKTMIPSKSS